MKREREEVRKRERKSLIYKVQEAIPSTGCQSTYLKTSKVFPAASLSLTTATRLLVVFFNSGNI